MNDLPDRRMRGVIRLDIFSMDVAIFDREDARLKCLTDQGCTDLDRHDDAAIASAHMDTTESGSVRLSMVIKPHATMAAWAHECVHIADFVMHRLQMPMGVENTEVRAYLVGHLFSGLQDILSKKRGRK